MKPHWYYSDIDLRDEAIERERERMEAGLAWFAEEQAYLDDQRAGIHDQEDEADLGRYDEELT